jgi:hypothetical protein
MILLDTHALLWLESGHRRARPLTKVEVALYVSPASLLEVAFLIEVGRVRAKRGLRAWSLADDDRWRLDEPPSAAWFEEAASLGIGAIRAPLCETRWGVSAAQSLFTKVPTPRSVNSSAITE